METERAIASWWQGIQLWYNANDFRSAMECWNEALETLDIIGKNGISSIEKQIYDGKEGDFLPGRIENDPRKKFAPLMLFLAGCWLDAGEVRLARKLCATCLTICPVHLAPQVVTELIATYQEDNAYPEPWIKTKEIAEYAVANGLTNWVNAWQRPGYFYPIGVSQPVYTHNDIPSWCREIENRYKVIRDEFEQLYQQNGYKQWPVVGAGNHRNGAGAHDGAVVHSGDWREIVLFGSGANPHLAPRTSAIVEQYAKDAVDLANAGGGEVIFSLMSPKTTIVPHCASTNLRLTAHLGLTIPKNCYIRVAGEKIHWKEGEMIVFDDSFEHGVVNDSDEFRALLLFRFWHPNIPIFDRQNAMQKVLIAKEEDQLRRYNPPLPTGHILNHGLKRSHCIICGRSGFESIRVVQNFNDWTLCCVCGGEID